MHYRFLALICGFLLALPLFCQEAPSSTAKKPSDAKAAEAAKDPVPANFALEDGTPVRLRANHAVSPSQLKAGDALDFEVMEDVRVNGVVVIPSGGIAWASITEAQTESPDTKAHKLDIHIDSVRLADGGKAPLRAIKKVKHAEGSTTAIDPTSLVFVHSAPFSSFAHGKQISRGAEVTAYINGDIPLEFAKFQKQEPAPDMGADAPQDPGVMISSNPGKAEIEVDGKPSGHTPLSVELSPGEHTIKITKDGYKPWERKITVVREAMKVVADLEPTEK
jgi:PEGA domain